MADTAVAVEVTIVFIDNTTLVKHPKFADHTARKVREALCKEFSDLGVKINVDNVEVV
jgi:hypothetical protein